MLYFSAKFKLHYGDMTDSSCLVKIVSLVKPTEIYNLAAQSHVKVILKLILADNVTLRLAMKIYATISVNEIS